MTPEDYYKHKSNLLQFRLEEIQIETIFNELQTRKKQYCQENNLPTGNVKFNDKEFSISELNNG